jgi:hypothetical protein
MPEVPSDCVRGLCHAYAVKLAMQAMQAMHLASKMRRYSPLAHELMHNKLHKLYPAFPEMPSATPNQGSSSVPK